MMARFKGTDEAGLYFQAMMKAANAVAHTMPHGSDVGALLGAAIEVQAFFLSAIPTEKMRASMIEDMALMLREALAERLAADDRIAIDIIVPHQKGGNA